MLASKGSDLRVALVGAGWVSAFHLAAWRDTLSATVTGICDPDLQRAEARALQFSIPAAFQDAKSMLDALQPDALDIASPVETHGALCRLAAERGVHVLCQKPLGRSFAEARDTVAAVDGRTRLMVHENWRFRPHYRRIRGWLEDGALGDPVSCVIGVRSSGLIADARGSYPQLDRQPFFANLERLLIGEVLVHHLDLVGWLMGPQRIIAARAGRRCPAVRGDDHAFLLLAGSSTWSSIDASLVSPGAPVKSEDAFRLTGTEGVAELQGSTLRLMGSREESFELDLDAAYRASYAGAIGHFAGCLRTGAPFETPPEVHLAALDLVEHAYAAAGPLH